MTNKDYDYLFKLLIIGDSGVGKSCLLLRFSDDTFSPTYITTIGVDFKIKTLMIDNEKVKLQIWDTAGQERFRTITSTYYRGTQGVIVVFDLTSEPSFVNVKRWLQEIFTNCDNVSRVLVGNKMDFELGRQVSQEDIEEFSKQNSLQFFLTSAKNGTNVEDVFYYITRKVLEKTKQEKQNNTQTSNIDLKKKKKSGRKKQLCYLL